MIDKPKMQDNIDTDSSFESDIDQPVRETKKKVYRNTLEKNRRKSLKNSYYRFKKIVPDLANDEVTSRAQILESIANFIDYMEAENERCRKIIHNMAIKNLKFKEKIAILEKIINN